jgi:hypothetical protein
VFDLQLFFRCVLNGACNPLPVLRSEDQRAQDKEVQRALQEFEPFSASWVDI